MARYSALGLTALKSRCHPGLSSSPGLSPLLSLLVVGRIHFFAAIGWKSPFFFLLVGQGLHLATISSACLVASIDVYCHL